MAQIWKVRVPYGTVVRGLSGPAVPPAGKLQPPKLESHQWLALGAAVSGGLAVWVYTLAARGKHTEAATVGLLTALGGTIVAVIGHMNTPARAQAEAEQTRQLVHQAIWEAQSGPPDGQVVV